jgi:hypothetical protein
MRTKTITWIMTFAVLAALAMPVRLAAQEQIGQKTKHHHYKLIDIGTLGGPNSECSCPLRQSGARDATKDMNRS